MKDDIRRRALGNQVTRYDKEGNIIEQIPPPPPVPPKVTYVNIIEIEDKIMGIDSKAIPDFFLDFENDERFMDIEKCPEFNQPVKILNRRRLSEAVCAVLIGIASVVFGYSVV